MFTTCRSSLVAMALLLACGVCMATLQSDLEAELWESACALNSNDSYKYEYYSSVRRQYGDYDNPQKAGRYVMMNVGGVYPVRCYNCCMAPDSVTWCVYIYHPSKNIQICLNASGVLMETPSAAILRLSESLSLQAKACPGYTSPGCLWVSKTPYYFNKAYFVCTSSSTSCARNTFIESTVTGNGKDIRITDFPEEAVRVVRGRTVTLKCSSAGTSPLNVLQWIHANHTSYTAIYEDPFCNATGGNNCGRDTTSVVAQSERVRMYVISNNASKGCLPLTHIVSYLVINNATEEDEGLYTCTAFTTGGLPDLMDRSKSFNLTLQVVAEIPRVIPTAVLSTSTEVQIIPTVTTAGGEVILTGARAEKYSSAIFIYASSLSLLLIVGMVAIGVVLLVRRRRRYRLAKSVVNMENPYSHEATLNEKNAMLFVAPDPWRFPVQKLTIFRNKVLGTGAFGKVVLAKAEGIDPHSPEKDIVAVKTAKDGVFHSESNDLFDELELMKKLKPHENIINLLGYCIEEGGPPCLIVEYAMHGSLRNFLKSCKEAALSLNHQPIIVKARARTESCSSESSSHALISSTTPTSGYTFFHPRDGSKKLRPSPAHPHHPPCTPQDSGYGGSAECYQEEEEEEERVAHQGGTATPLAHTLVPITHDYVNCKGLVYMEDVENFAIQIASGLKHLSEMEIVHCDLAARNILIGDGFVLKISDFGMARDISGKEYYRKSPKGHIPVKWTSPEALEENMYTFKSDIWSLGVVLWEIFTYGQTPYPDIDINSMEPFIQYLKNGNRLPRPDGCPEYMYNLMQLCWDLDPGHRPSANQLMDTFITRHSGQMCISPMSLAQSQEFIMPEIS